MMAIGQTGTHKALPIDIRNLKTYSLQDNQWPMGGGPAYDKWTPGPGLPTSMIEVWGGRLCHFLNNNIRHNLPMMDHSSLIIMTKSVS
jgi:hypothetical protein